MLLKVLGLIGTRERNCCPMCITYCTEFASWLVRTPFSINLWERIKQVIYRMQCIEHECSCYLALFG